MENRSNIIGLFLQAAERYPENIAIDEGDTRITYFDLKKEVEKKSAYFQSKGIQKGDRVLVFVPMGMELYVNVLALFHCGATAVFLDEWVNRKRMILCCKLAECKGFVAPKKVRWLARTSKTLRGIPVWLYSERTFEDRKEVVDVEGDDTALITFTTGSTGTPKAAKRTHAFLHEQFKALEEEMQPQADEINLTLLPIVLFVNLGSGNTSVIPSIHKKVSEEEKAKQYMRWILNKQITSIVSSPALLLQMAEVGGNTSSVRKVFTGGAPVFPSDAKKLVEAFSSADVSVVYGSTEAEPISRIEAKELAATGTQNGLAVGRIYHKAQVKIIRITEESIALSNWKEWELGVGEVGEIIVSGDHVLKEYYNNENVLKRNKIVDGSTIWHRTGDSGRVNEKGELFLYGRCTQLIESKGKLLSPFIVEDQLKQIPGIRTGTILRANSKIMLVVESDESESALASKLHAFVYDQLKVLKEIPRDPRHRSKLDVESLQRLI